MRGLVLSCVALLSLTASCSSSEPKGLAAMAEACSQHGGLSCPRPIFNVRSLRDSIVYYRESLGFKLDWEHGDPADFGSVSRDHANFFLCEGCQGTPGAWSMVFAPDVDQLHEEFRKNGALIRLQPTNMPWGMRELHVSDPDGNVIRFGSGISE